jgi:Icc-related predicted phosphoesterase
MTKIYFCTDIHGSTKCWRKVVSAGEFYKADVVILGGDMTGKIVNPIVGQTDGTFTSDFLGRRWVIKDRKELEDHERLIVEAGSYVYETSPNELEELKGNKARINEILKEKVIERIRKWIEIADTKLGAQGRRILVAPGNDDYPFIDPVLDESDTIKNVEGKVIDLDGHHEMLSCGWSNPTPWQTPRETSEEELAKKIQRMASQAKDLKNSVFNLHAPPFGSGLDVAPKLKENLQVALGGVTAAVGSTAVHDAIQKYQPILGLHGHIHEAMGRTEIGRTLCLNPGSNYTEGILNGVVVVLDGTRIKSVMFTSG